MQKQLRRTRYERGVPRPGILPKLRADSGRRRVTHEKAHDLLKQTGDELADVLDCFTEHAHENPFHPTQH